MASKGQPQDQPSWLLEPLRSGEVRVQVHIDEGAKLSPELRDALERLGRALQEDEIRGYALSLSSSTPQLQTFGQLGNLSRISGLTDCSINCSPNCGLYGGARLLPR
jgi:hypothetical protein